MTELNNMFGTTPLEKEAEKQKIKESVAEFSGLDPQQQAKKIIEMFREVFGTDHGKIVLGLILEDLYYFRDCTNDEARALNNYAKILLGQRLGFNNNKKRVDALFNTK